MERSPSGKGGTALSFLEGIVWTIFYSIDLYYTIRRPQPVTATTSDARSRSKTFEEYKKYTDDAWDEEPGDISELSAEAQLEFEHLSSNTKGRQKRENGHIIHIIYC